MKHFLTAFLMLPTLLCAQNPILHFDYSADPAPVVFEDTLYVYYDRDIGITPSGDTYYYMTDWHVASTTDMVNWTDHGAVLPLSTFKWATEGTAWASQCIERDGKYYWYVCAEYPNHWHAIGVAVGSSPTGPFSDALGSPLISTSTSGDIDPTVFIDNDGQAYLYFGNNKLCYVKLNKDMISYDHSIGTNGIVTVDLTEESFGGVKQDGVVNGENCFEEGPWLDRRGDIYYLAYAGGGVPENLSYSTSTSPTGPWTYRGMIMPVSDTGSFTNHGGFVNFRGQEYLFYHTGWLNEGNGGGGFNRSVAVQPFTFNADGTIPEQQPSRTGCPAIAKLNPYQSIIATTHNNAVGLEVGGGGSEDVYVTGINSNDSLSVTCVDFGSEGAQSISMEVSALSSGITVYVLIADGGRQRIANLSIPSTESHDVRQTVTADLTSLVTGEHRIRFWFVGSADARIYSWQFNHDDATTVGITSSTTDRSPVRSTSFLSLDGRLLSDRHTHGIYLERLLHADGSTTTVKRVAR